MRPDQLPPSGQGAARQRVLGASIQEDARDWMQEEDSRQCLREKMEGARRPQHRPGDAEITTTRTNELIPYHVPWKGFT